MRLISLVVLPTSAFLAAAAPVLIVPVLGARWSQYRESFLVLSLLTAYAGARTLLGVFFEGYKTVGKPGLIFAYHTARLIVIVPLMLIGARFGILGLAVGYLPLYMLEIPAALALASHVLQVAPRAVLAAIFPPLLASTLMAGVVLVTAKLSLSSGIAGDTGTLLLCLLAATGAYLAVLVMVDRAIFAEARRVFRSGL
jgi:hypothetical protein